MSPVHHVQSGMLLCSKYSAIDIPLSSQSVSQTILVPLTYSVCDLTVPEKIYYQANVPSLFHLLILCLCSYPIVVNYRLLILKISIVSVG